MKGKHVVAGLSFILAFCLAMICNSITHLLVPYPAAEYIEDFFAACLTVGSLYDCFDRW